MIDFTQEQQVVIAEFVSATGTDTLIKTEAEKLINVLIEHKLIEDKEGWLKKLEDKHPDLVNHLLNVLQLSIPDEQGGQIMADYYSGKIS